MSTYYMPVFFSKPSGPFNEAGSFKTFADLVDFLVHDATHVCKAVQVWEGDDLVDTLTKERLILAFAEHNSAVAADRQHDSGLRWPR